MQRNSNIYNKNESAHEVVIWLKQKHVQISMLLYVMVSFTVELKIIDVT